MKKSKGNLTKKINDEIVTLEITFEGAEDVPILYASNVFVRHENDVFLLTFAQAHGPYLIDITKEELESMKTIPAKIVARLAIPPSRMKEIVNVLSGNYEAYEKRIKNEEKD